MLEKKFTKNAEKTYFFVFAECILKRNLPRIFISKPVLRFRLNDEVQLTEVQKNWDENIFKYVVSFLHFISETGFLVY